MCTRNVVVLLATVALLMCAQVVWSATYYVSTAGSDAGAGTIGDPWRHVCYAVGGGGTIVGTGACPTTNANKLVAGDTLYVRGGTYNEIKIITPNDGTAGSPITIRNYPDETPIVDGNAVTGDTDAPVFRIDGDDYITINGLKVTRGGGYGFKVGENASTTDLVITNCEIYDIKENAGSPLGAVYFGTNVSGATISYNKIHPGYTTKMTGIVMHRGGNDTVITHNEIYNVTAAVWYKHGITTGTGMQVTYNLIHDVLTYGIETRSDSGVISHNVIYTGGVAQGIRVYEEGSCDVNFGTSTTITHNTIIDVTSGIPLWGPGNQCAPPNGYAGALNTVVRDNLIYNFTGTEHRGVSVWRYSPPTWLASTAYVVTNISKPSTPNGHRYIVTTAGTSSGSAPTWCTTAACTVADGTVVWTEDGDLDKSNTTFEYNLVYSPTVTPGFVGSLGTTYAVDAPPATIVGSVATNLASAPTFANYAGRNFTLASGSVGENAASDGTDMGALICEVGINPTCDISPPIDPDIPPDPAIAARTPVVREPVARIPVQRAPVAR